MNTLRKLFLRSLVGWAAAISWLAPADGLASITLSPAGSPFQVTFYDANETDNSGTVGQQNWTQQQMALVIRATRFWSDGIRDVWGRPVQVHAFWNNLPGNALAESFDQFVGNGTAAFTSTEVVWREGLNYAPFIFDTKLVFDTTPGGGGWSFGRPPSSTQVDFLSVVSHEIGHSVGFNSTYDFNNDNKWWDGGITAWDALLRDDKGNQPAPGGTGAPGPFNVVDNPVFFVGANAEGANGGNPVPIYAPTTFAFVSSLVHLNESAFPHALMSPVINAGEVARRPSNLEWAIMSDLGWNVVPEPGTLIVWLGLGAFGVVVLWRRDRGKSLPRNG